MTMNGALHRRSNVGRLHLKRCEGGRGLLSVEECVLAGTKILSEYTRKKEEPMLKEVRSKKISCQTRKEEYQKKMHDDKSKGFTEKGPHGKFRKSTEAIADEKSWEWLKMGHIRKRTEAIITDAQDQALQTNWSKHTIDEQDISPKCRTCQTEHQLVMHLASGSKGLTKRQYKVRLDAVGRRVH